MIYSQLGLLDSPFINTEKTSATGIEILPIAIFKRKTPINIIDNNPKSKYVFFLVIIRLKEIKSTNHGRASNAGATLLHNLSATNPVDWWLLHKKQRHLLHLFLRCMYKLFCSETIQILCSGHWHFPFDYKL